MPSKLALGWTLLILIACSIPGPAVPSTSLLELDKLAHFVLFAGFGWLWLWAYPDRTLVVLGAGLLYAAGTEVYQGLLPLDRYPEVLDFVANAFGLSAAVGVHRFWRRRLPVATKK